MKSHLKVKVFSLCSEMTYIRRQELKWKEKARVARLKAKEGKKSNPEYCEQNFWSQRYHRYDLKKAARITHLAYGAMKGIPYSSMETICYGVLKGYGSSEPNWGDIQATVERFSKDEPNTQEIMQRLSEWLHDAKLWYDGNENRIEYTRAVRDDARRARAADPIYLDAMTAEKERARAEGIAKAHAAA
jgi:hypothetical protein